MIPYRRLMPLFIFFVVVLISSLSIFIASFSHSVTSPIIGKKIPFFTIASYPDPAVSFTPDQWKGRPSIINFFASWCVPCKAEHPALMQLARSGKVRLYGIAWKDTPANLKRWFDANGNPYHAIGIDNSGRTTLLFGLSGVPETFIINHEGNVVYHYRSALTEEIISKEIVPLLDTLYQNNGGQ